MPRQLISSSSRSLTRMRPIFEHLKLNRTYLGIKNWKNLLIFHLRLLCRHERIFQPTWPHRFLDACGYSGSHMVRDRCLRLELDMARIFSSSIHSFLLSIYFSSLIDFKFSWLSFIIINLFFWKKNSHTCYIWVYVYSIGYILSIYTYRYRVFVEIYLKFVELWKFFYIS